MFTDEQREEITFQFEKHKYYSIQLILKRLESARSAGYDSETLDYLFRSELSRAVMIDQAEPENVGRWQNWLDAHSFRT